MLADVHRQRERAKGDENDDLRATQTETEIKFAREQQTGRTMQCVTALNIAVYATSGLLFVWGLYSCLRLTILVPR